MQHNVHSKRAFHFRQNIYFAIHVSFYFHSNFKKYSSSQSFIYILVLGNHSSTIDKIDKISFSHGNQGIRWNLEEKNCCFCFCFCSLIKCLNAEMNVNCKEDTNTNSSNQMQIIWSFLEPDESNSCRYLDVRETSTMFLVCKNISSFKQLEMVWVCLNGYYNCCTAFIIQTWKNVVHLNYTFDS